MGTLGLDEERLLDASFTINFGAIRTHHNLFGKGVTYLAGQ
jgi:hypothetical protein